MEINSEEKVFQYIELTKDLEFRDFIGRFTLLIKGAIGFIVTDDTVEKVLADLSNDRKGRYFDILEDAIESNKFPALISGYLCSLSENDFIRVKAPKSTPVPGLII
jgi:hypothetical protein